MKNIAKLTLFLLLLIGANQVQACSCSMSDGPLETLEKSSAVFHGKVISKYPSTMLFDFKIENIAIKFNVLESWKGISGDTITVKTEINGASCGYNFEQGKEYIVYAYGDIGGLRTGLCTRTVEIKYGYEDLQKLNGKFSVLYYIAYVFNFYIFTFILLVGTIFSLVKSQLTRMQKILLSIGNLINLLLLAYMNFYLAIGEIYMQVLDNPELLVPIILELGIISSIFLSIYRAYRGKKDATLISFAPAIICLLLGIYFYFSFGDEFLSGISHGGYI